MKLEVLEGGDTGNKGPILTPMGQAAESRQILDAQGQPIEPQACPEFKLTPDTDTVPAETETPTPAAELTAEQLQLVEKVKVEIAALLTTKTARDFATVMLTAAKMYAWAESRIRTLQGFTPEALGAFLEGVKISMLTDEGKPAPFSLTDMVKDLEKKVTTFVITEAKQQIRDNQRAAAALAVQQQTTPAQV